MEGSRRGRRVWVVPGIELARAMPPVGDPDDLLTRSDCRIVKMQRKVLVGRVETPAGALYVKRYNVFAGRVALEGLLTPSPAARAWAGAQALAARGFRVPDLIAAMEYRILGVLRRSFLVTREVEGGLTADAYWHALGGEPDVRRRRTARRALVRALGALFRDLHAAGVYHRDLKDANLLVSGAPTAPVVVLLDLEQVRLQARLGRRRRLKNLVQLARTLGRHVRRVDQVRFLRVYLGPTATPGERRAWARAVLRAAARKSRRRAGGASSVRRDTVTCTIVCQNEEAMMRACLESVAWCDEIVVVDGGSSDGTVARAQEFTDRVIFNAWPGYRAQKQFALDAARSDWILNIDADERVTPELRTEIMAALATAPPEVAGFAIPRLVCYLGRWWYRGGWYPRRILRLMRRSNARWGGTDPHERAEVDGRIVGLAAPLLHYSYTDTSDHLRSVNGLTAIAAAQRRRWSRIGFARLVAEPAWRFLRGYLLQRGFREGFPGLFVTATGAFYVFLRWAKVWEATTPELRPEVDFPPHRR